MASTDPRHPLTVVPTPATGTALALGTYVTQAEGGSVMPLAADRVERWTAEADVVVVGTGAAGGAAAVEAAATGADVLVLESTGGWGGAAALSGGFIYLGGGTAIQRACGFDDSAEEMFKFLSAAMGPGADVEKLTVYAEESVDHFEWLVQCGVTFNAAFFAAPSWVPGADEGLMYSGGENAWPFNELAKPAPRGHLPVADRKASDGSGGGQLLMESLRRTAAGLGVRTQYDTRALRLIVASDGRVTGVVARQFGEPVAVAARRGVVLATGGFSFNADMMTRFAPRLFGRPSGTIPQHDGRSIRMAQALGADVAHLDACEVSATTEPQLMARGLMVNRVGQRFVNEDTYPGRIAQAMLAQDDQTFLIVDEEGYEACPEAVPAMVNAGRAKAPPTWVCETLPELEEEMGLPEGALSVTVELFNRHAARGDDPFFHKAAEWLRPLHPPYGAYDLRGSTHGFPTGGLLTRSTGEVLNVDGDPIAGLYAAGRATTGLGVAGYASGISVGDGTFFGRRAGRSAARDAQD